MEARVVFPTRNILVQFQDAYYHTNFQFHHRDEVLAGRLRQVTIAGLTLFEAGFDGCYIVRDECFQPLCDIDPAKSISNELCGKVLSVWSWDNWLHDLPGDIHNTHTWYHPYDDSISCDEF